MSTHPFLPLGHREQMLWRKVRMDPRRLRIGQQEIERKAMKKLVKKTSSTLLTIGGVGLALAGAVKLFSGRSQ